MAAEVIVDRQFTVSYFFFLEVVLQAYVGTPESQPFDKVRQIPDGGGQVFLDKQVASLGQRVVDTARKGMDIPVV